MKRFAVFASGRGSNFKAMIDHVKLGVLRNVEIALLITNIPDAPVVALARENSIPSVYIEGVYGRKFANKQVRQEVRNKFDEEALNELRQGRVDFIALAGFMQVLGPTLVDAYPFRILNIHPAKNLALFGGSGMFGERVHAAVIQAGEKESGCTVHFVDNSIDGGPIILQATVPVERSDTPESLAHKILIHEHRTYSKAIQLHADNRIAVKDGGVEIDWSRNWDEEWSRRQEAFIRNQAAQSNNSERLLSQSV
jgi:phosphoribosylglycinamide formyltransferase-1